MMNLKSSLRHLSIALASLLIVMSPVYPVIAFADTAPESVARPTGAAAATFSYNAGNGLWENNYYTFNPATKETLPKQAPEYTYNQATGLWESTVWEYHPTVSSYEPVAVAVATPPAGAVTHGSPTPAIPTPQPAPATELPSDTISPPSQPSVDTVSSAPADTVVDNTIGVTLNSTVTSNAQSGNALGQGNYSVKDATSGDAAAMATVINLLQSSAGIGGGSVATFVKDIQGDVSGDLLIDPAAFMQPASTPHDLGNVQINTAIDTTINNNINLAATSGNATLDDNYSAGNATTGSANAVANVVNLINSVIAANQSFLGVVNIYGNYTGDIVVPTDTLNSLLASNSASAPDVAQASQAASALTTQSLQTINNNVDLNAISGNASQSGNTTTGNADTGNAMTNLTILNLTGHQVSAANSLLVFVNVLGKWVGVIMDAPTGATSAAFAGGSTAQGAGTQSVGSTTIAGSQTINNNITASAVSGDATISDNFRAGDARTGQATASANIANLMHSAFSLSDWFGVLFINVFGNWLGNFGVAKTNPPAADRTNSDSPVIAPAVFSFRPTGSDTAASGSELARVDRAMFATDEQYETFNNQIAEVLAAHDVVPHAPKTVQTQADATGISGLNLSMLPIALGLTGLFAVGAERIRSIRRR